MAGQVIYTAEAHVTGGRVHGHGKTSDGALEVDIRPPGDEEAGTNPEQLFAVGYAACFESAMGAIARREKVDVGDVSIDSRVHLITTENRGFNVSVEMDVIMPGITDPDLARKIVEATHGVCPYSNATRGNIDATFTANGEPV